MTLAQKILSVCMIATLIGCSGKTTTAESGKETAETTAEKNGAEAEAKISPEAAEQSGIEILTAGPASIRETLTLYGSIRPNAEREQDIRARYPGVVRSVNKRAGDAVEKGETLFTIESNESLQVYPVSAPLSGRILDRSVNAGDAVDSSTVLMKVADLSSVWAEFAIFARDLAHVRPKMRVLFSGADADERGEAAITYIAPAGHSDSQSVIARAVIDNRGSQWVPGQFVTGDVITADIAAPVTVHPAALQELQGKNVVFVQKDQGFQPRQVQVGKRSRDAVEITKGLTAGEHYAAKNSYLIKADLLKGEAEEE